MDNDLMLNNRLKECGTEKIVTLKDVTQQLTTFIWKIIRHHCFRRNDTDGWRYVKGGGMRIDIGEVMGDSESSR
ncbi:hypothetical protein T07_12626 [Trichinella nelsoni]|uniref:Uncharacterized protein n=1 Tax=Trichinella nelsoni TaxID=6336 RepID=A0A0V0SER0_9BILA|nr:hypothetical protein T07_12626 [Trichinella nelsoni]